MVISLKDCIRKIKQLGKAICTVCCKSDSDIITYSKGGLGTLKQHIMGKDHEGDYWNAVLQASWCCICKIRRELWCTTCIPWGTCCKYKSTSSSNVSCCRSCNEPRGHGYSIPGRKILGIQYGRTHHWRELSKNRQTLAKLHLFQTTASYKMLYGTNKTFNDKLVKTLQTAPFALNMDEATASNNSRVCAVLVTYSKGNNIITEHLNSFTTPFVSGEILFEGMKSLFERRKLPWINLLAIDQNPV